MAETEDALRAEVPVVCRTYCALTWDEALNQAGVKAFSMLKRAESVYYLPAISFASSSDSKADPAPSEAAEPQGSPPRTPPIANTSSEGGEQPRTLQELGMPKKAQSKALLSSNCSKGSPQRKRNFLEHGTGVGNSCHTPKSGPKG